MVNLITNRTQADVDHVKELAARGWENLTTAERNEWLGVDAQGNEIETPCTRGAYNYRDLNRIGLAVNEISEQMAIGVTVKTDWAITDIPRSADLVALLGAIKMFRTRNPDVSSVPLPDSLEYLTWQVANDIEQFLLDAYNYDDPWTMLAETTVVFQTNMAVVSGIGSDIISENGKYIVTWKGTDYECAAYVWNESVCLGNAALMGSTENTGEPFVFEVLTATESIVTKSSSAAATITLKIQGVKNV